MDKEEIEVLEKIAKGIDKTIDICDLYLIHQDFLDLNKIIDTERELKMDKEDIQGKDDDDEMKFTKIIDSFDKKVMFGFSEYEDGKGNKEGFILFRFEESNVSGQRKFYTEQKIHIDNKVKETIKRWLNEG